MDPKRSPVDEAREQAERNAKNTGRELRGPALMTPTHYVWAGYSPENPDQFDEPFWAIPLAGGNVEQWQYLDHMDEIDAATEFS